jgi:hypothetical protein
MDQAMTLLFVYNAKSGLLHGMMDAIHKIAAPHSYPCSLCALTYGAVSMSPAWKKFLATLPLPAEFTYKAEFRARYPRNKDALPAIFLVGTDTPELLVAATDIAAQADVNALMATLTGRLAGRGTIK